MLDANTFSEPVGNGNASRLSFASFWAGGDLPALDKACLLSLVHHGHPVTLYSFETLKALPSDIAVRDAREIVPSDWLNAFPCGGAPSLSHFSDYFRYHLFQRIEHAWIDTDMLMLRPLDVGPAATLLARESDTSICSAIMRLPGDSPALAEVIRRAERLAHTNLVWGATGPRLLTQVFGESEVFKQAHPPERFFPINHNDFWKPFHPNCAGECEYACQNAFTLHLWNSTIVRMEIWKEVAPPEGSFLRRCLRERGLLSLFRHTYPADVMQNMIETWLLRKNGGDVPLGPLVRQTLPSAARTLMPRIRSFLQQRL